MSCPKCNNRVYGGTDRIIGITNHCPICGFVEVMPLTVHLPMSAEQFSGARYPKRDPDYAADPCPVIGCTLGIPKGRKLVMCQTCRNTLGRWKKKGSIGPPPLFKNEEGAWERRDKK